MKHVKAYLLGLREFRRAITQGYSCDSLQNTYDLGRDRAHRLTLRRYED